MAKKLVDVEDLVVWAASELSRKRPGKSAAPPPLDVSRSDRELTGKWDRPMGLPSMHPMWAGGFGTAGVARGDPPHDDAFRVEEAIERLRWTSLGVYNEPSFVDGIGFAVDVEGALRAALRNVPNLLLVHGRLGSRPSLRLEPPAVSPKLASNGKPGVWRVETWMEPVFGERADSARDVEVACVATRKGHYPAGAYGVLVFEPAPQELVDERAEYAAWRAGLEWLAAELAGKMETRTALSPRAAVRPWMGEQDGEPVRDLFRPGVEGVWSGDEAATLAAERSRGRRRPVAGGSVYGFRPGRPGRGAREA